MDDWIAVVFSTVGFLAISLLPLAGYAQEPEAPADPPSIVAEESVSEENAENIDSTGAVSSKAVDAQLRNRLSAIFSRLDALESVEVSVTSGVVELTGEVEAPTARETAESIAREFDDTLYVENNISVSTQVTERVEPALERAMTKIREFIGYLPLFAVAMAILALFWFLARLVVKLKLPGTKFEDRPFLQSLVRQIISLVVFLVGFVFVLDLFGVATLVGAVLGTAGLAGLALGFAFRDIAENYLASIMLSVHQPFDKNDLVRVMDLEGKVVRMTTRDTVLMTLSGNHIRIPNSTVFKNPTHNFTRNPRRRFEFRVGVGVDEELREAQQIGIETLRSTDGVLAEPEPTVEVEELAESTVTLACFGWVNQIEHDWVRVNSEAIRRVKSAFDAADIDMPEPTYRIRTLDAPAAESHDTKKRRAREELQETGPAVEATMDLDKQIEEDRAHSEETDLIVS